MRRKSSLINKMIILSLLLLLSSCNLPSKAGGQTPYPSANSIGAQNSPYPITTLCNNPYFPSTLGKRWEYSGNNSAIGAYTRTDTITQSTSDSFSVDSNYPNVTYSVDYTCSAEGLTASNPLQQYLGALLSDPNTPVNVNLTSNSGISLPARINPDDTWQQVASFDAATKEISLNGRFVFNYSAAGYEQVTVPYGTFDALRVNATIRIEVSGLRILAGTYSTTFWLVPNIGMVKSQGSSQLPGVDFTDQLELTGFKTSP